MRRLGGDLCAPHHALAQRAVVRGKNLVLVAQRLATSLEHRENSMAA